MNERLIPGKRYRVTFEGTANPAGGLRFDGADDPRGAYAPSGVPARVVSVRATKVERLPDPAPVWKPGDVVVVRWSLGSKPYTYVRGARTWPGDETLSKKDAEISRLWREGKAEPVLQAGGAPFDRSRLPQRPLGAYVDALDAQARLYARGLL